MGNNESRPSTIVQALAPVVQVLQTNVTLNQMSDLEAKFIKGIKRYLSTFAKLKDDTKWHDWKKQLHVTVKSQAISNVLDPTYIPETAKKGLFEQQQIYMISIFKEKLLTSKAKNIVAKYESGSDTQSLYKALVKEYKEGIGQDQLVSTLRKKWQDF